MRPPNSPDDGRDLIARRSAVLGLFFLLTAGGAVAVTPRRHEQSLGHQRLKDVIPNKVGQWSAGTAEGLILPESTPQQDDFYDQLLARAFIAPSLPPIMLLIAYGSSQSGLMKVHRPEVCYSSAGFAITDDRPDDIRLQDGRMIPAKAFAAERDNRVERVLYWTRISDAFPRNLTAQRLIMLRRGLAGVIPDGVLVRFSTISDDATVARAAMRTFARELVAVADWRGRALLLGAAQGSGGL